ncbi:MAG TPA: glycerate kinase [Polyangiaceae bacterium]|nr:glycerate kinase [Polyangiaceae bacterium]
MRVLLAFDKFKGALGAEQACAVAATVLRRERPDWQLDLAPLSDGGDGFCRILTDALGGEREQLSASGPLVSPEGSGEPRDVEIGWVDLERVPEPARARLALPDASLRRLAIVELAAINGLASVPPERRDVWRSSSFGTGELLRAAMERGAQALLLGVGGSACCELGLGALSALGLRFEDAAGVRLPYPVPGRFAELVRVCGRVAPPLAPLCIACDVDSPLLGPHGAAALYGPQKGLDLAQLPRFEAQASRLARLLCEHAGCEPGLVNQPGAGAAGGVAFGLCAVTGARLLPGFELVSEVLDLTARLERADWVITGEGRFDATSLVGKGPGSLVQHAALRGRRCTVLAGSLGLEPGLAERSLPGVAVRAISPPDLPLQQALAETPERLARAIQACLAEAG